MNQTFCLIVRQGPAHAVSTTRNTGLPLTAARPAARYKYQYHPAYMYLGMYFRYAAYMYLGMYVHG